MRWPRGLRPVWSLAALALALTLLVAPTAARAQDDDEDDDSGGQGTIKIYSHDSRDDESKQSSGSGYLGVQVQDVTRSLQRARNLPTEEGALINSVEPDSPADRNGIRRGDVIVEVDGQKISDSGDLIRVVRGLEPGNRVRITLWRSGSLRTVSAPLAERPKTPPPPRGLPGGDDDEMTWTTPAPPATLWMGDQKEMQRQIKDLQDQVQQLREELRALRSELRKANDRDNDSGNNDRGDD